MAVAAQKSFVIFRVAGNICCLASKNRKNIINTISVGMMFASMVLLLETGLTLTGQKGLFVSMPTKAEKSVCEQASIDLLTRQGWNAGGDNLPVYHSSSVLPAALQEKMGKAAYLGAQEAVRKTCSNEMWRYRRVITKGNGSQ